MLAASSCFKADIEHILGGARDGLNWMGVLWSFFLRAPTLVARPRRLRYAAFKIAHIELQSISST